MTAVAPLQTAQELPKERDAVELLSFCQDKGGGAFKPMQASVLLPLVVSLSLTRKVPRLFCRFKRSRSESRRVIFPKYHLQEHEISQQITRNNPWLEIQRTLLDGVLVYWEINVSKRLEKDLISQGKINRKKCNFMCKIGRGGDYVLFCLDGVRRSHVVAGDVSALSCRQGPSEPPVPFSATHRYGQ